MVVSNPFTTRLRTRLAIVVAAALAGPVAAQAAINPPHAVISSPTDELVILEGYNPAAGPVTINVMRGTLKVGSSGPHVVPAGGVIEINHPVDLGDVPHCWNAFTPDVTGGDVLQIVQGGVTETTQLHNMTVTAPVEVDAFTLEVHGTATDATGTRLPIDELGVELRAGNAFGPLFGGGPAILAPGVRTGPGGTVTGTLAYDNATDPSFTATFVFTVASSQDVAMTADASAGWLLGNEAMEVGVAPEPPEPGLVSCTEPSGAYAAVATAPNVVNDNTPSLVVRGAAPAEATAVTVTLSDTDPLTTVHPTASGTLTQPTVGGGKVWEATFSEAQIETLTDGTLTATPVFEPGTVTGIARTVQKNGNGLATAVITAGPAEGSTSTEPSATFTFSSPVNDVTFECRRSSPLPVGDLPFAPCASPLSLTDLRNGEHTFAVRAVDGATAGLEVTRTWTVDKPLPVTTITNGPTSPTNATTATFTVSSTPAAAFFECNVDAAGFVACPAPLTYTGLAEGPHSLIVRGVDLPGNTGPASATYNWTVDLTAPNTTITAGPANGSNTADRTATFSFTATEAGSTFECRLNGSAFAPCTSPTTFTDLVDRSHTFDVRAKDAAGNVDATPASRTWEVNGPPETSITSGPPLSTTSHNATFVFSSNEPTATFECSLDNAAFTACTSPTNLLGLTVGIHSFRVRAFDPGLSLFDPTPANYSWSIDPPATTLTAAPPASTTATSATFSFTSPNDPAAGFECSLDGAAFAFCASPTTVTGLGLGSHTFRVRATDVSGTVDPTPASHAWDVVLPDTEAPSVTAAVGPIAKLTVARNGVLNVKTTCDERCTVIVRARVVVTSATPGGKTRIFRPASSPIVVNAAATGNARVKLNAIMLREVRKSLRAGKKVRITLTVSAKDAAGNEGLALRAFTLTKNNL